MLDVWIVLCIKTLLIVMKYLLDYSYLHVLLNNLSVCLFTSVEYFAFCGLICGTVYTGAAQRYWVI